MTKLPPSPFLESVIPSGTDRTAVAPSPLPPAESAAADLDDIGQIFVGARKLELDQLPGAFDPAAITTDDNLEYVLLKITDDHRTRDLPAIPDEEALFREIEAPPLFLQRCA